MCVCVYIYICIIHNYMHWLCIAVYMVILVAVSWKLPAQHCKKCGVIYDTMESLPHLIWCVCHFHSVIYYTNGVVSTLHLLQ